jgi:hypothetical protein
MQSRTMFHANIQQRTLGAPPQSLPRHRVNVAAAVKAGLLAGAVALFLLQFFSIVVYDESPWKLMRMIAAMVRGPGALEPDDEFDAALVAMATMLFMAIAMLYSVALAAIMSNAPRRHSAPLGIAFGVALYFVNFYGFTALFPWFASHRTIDTLVVHALFGLLIAKTYWLFRGR